MTTRAQGRREAEGMVEGGSDEEELECGEVGPPGGAAAEDEGSFGLFPGAVGFGIGGIWSPGGALLGLGPPLGGCFPVSQALQEILRTTTQV